MPTDKVKEFIKKLGAPKLTKSEIAIVKSHHEFHGDKKIKIIGALPHKRAFIRVINHTGHEDSVIDDLCYEDDCSEDDFIRNASENEEIRFLKKWLLRNLDEEERRTLIKGVAYDIFGKQRIFPEKAQSAEMDLSARLYAAVCGAQARHDDKSVQTEAARTGKVQRTSDRLSCAVYESACGVPCSVFSYDRAAS